MQGLELSRRFFEEFGRPMLEYQFPQVLPFLAAGLTGSGSECFGFDDELSRDHDFDPGFCLFLPSEEVVDRRTAFLLERAYAKLPREFMGVRRPLMGPAGGARRGVFRTEEFYREKLGSPDGTLTLGQWMTIPESALAEAVNGQIWMDNYGLVSKIRENAAFYPEEIRIKKLAGHLLLMAQAGQYNYLRCLKHGETGAAQLAAVRFSESAMQVIFLLNRVYQPFYKWSFRAMRRLPRLSVLAELLEYLLTSDNDKPAREEKYMVIESIAADIIEELRAQELTDVSCADLEKHAYAVNDRIRDAAVRNLHILAGT